MTYKTKPTAAAIKNLVENFNKNNWYDNENYLACIELTKAFIKNDNYKNIYIKVNFINGAFSTSIGDTYGLAKQISLGVKNIDVRLKEGDTSLVNEIGVYRAPKSGKTRNNYSFATKYCHCHKPHLFPINDQYVRNSLFEFNKNFHFSTFTKKDLANYDKFLEVLKDFRKLINDDKLENATIDRFLWVLGRRTAKRKRKQNN